MYKGTIKRNKGNAVKATEYTLNRMGISPAKVRQTLKPRNSFNATRMTLRNISK